MDRRRRVSGRSAAPCLPPESQRGRGKRLDGPQASSASKLRGREHRCERGGHRAGSPSPCRGRERRRGKGGRRAASASTFRCRRETDEPRAASPSTWRARGRRLERDGLRAASPSTSSCRARGRRLERDGPHAASPSTNRGRERRRARGGPCDASPSTRRGRERRRVMAVPCSASGSTRRDHERRGERDAPPVSPPSSHRSSQPPRERDAARPGSSASNRGHKRIREHDDHGASPTSHSHTLPPTEREALVHTTDGQRRDEKIELCPTISIWLGEDVLGEVIRRLAPVELCRMVSGSRTTHRLLNRGCKPQMMSPFIGTIVPSGNSYDVVPLMSKRMLRMTQRSAAYIQGSLKELTKETQIIDCRSGIMALKFGKEQQRFCICSPFQRKKWIMLPQYESYADEILAGALVSGSSFGFRLLLICIDKSIEGVSWPLVVKTFTSSTKAWERVRQSICFREGESLGPHGVHSGGLLYFLSKKRKEVIQVDPVHMGAEVIQLPEQILSQMVLTRVRGQLCFATAANKSIMISEYTNQCQWKLRWTRQTPSEAYWIKLLGSADENGMLIVETGSDQTHSLKIEDGIWFQLQHHSVSDSCIGLEISSSFRFPFPQPMYDIEDAMAECVKKGMLKDV